MHGMSVKYCSRCNSGIFPFGKKRMRYWYGLPGNRSRKNYVPGGGSTGIYWGKIMSSNVLTEYKKYRTRNRRFIIVLLFLLVAVGVVALVAGSHRIGWHDLLALLRGEGSPLNRQIILNIRLPRVLAAIATGVILSVAGAIMQILLRNPLASPYTLGISNAAAFGHASDCP